MMPRSNGMLVAWPSLASLNNNNRILLAPTPK